MGRTMIAALLALLGIIALGTLAAQVWFFPTLAGQLAGTYPELDWVVVPLLVLVIAAIAGVQAGLVALWVLLSMVERDRVFTTDAFRWVDVLIVAAGVDTALVAAIFVVLSFGAKANPPAFMLTQLALILCGVAFALLMIVMKGLLRKASTLRAELSEVI